MERIKQHDWLDKPTRCDSCQSPNIRFTQNKVIYGNNYGDWPYVWYCCACKAAVGCHPKSHFPMGRMADKDTRQARGRAHKYFDKIFRKHKLMSRSDAYAWLAREMQLEKKYCHISHFNAEQCERVVELSRRYIAKGKRKPRTITYTRGRKVRRPGHPRRKNQ